MSKPEVRYVDLSKCVVGERADVVLQHGEHPSPLIRMDGKTGWVRTSPVVSIIRHTFNGPVFETHNSIYLPYPVDAPGELHTVRSIWSPKRQSA